MIASNTWPALDAKRNRAKFGENEEKMLSILKRDFGLHEALESSGNEIRLKIEEWIKVKKQLGLIDEFGAMEAFRLNVILTAQLKINTIEQLASHSIGSIRQNMYVTLCFHNEAFTSDSLIFTVPMCSICI